ncbi:MAG: CinA family protein [Gammaproteobacteria bacterium]|nr:MAG: CinA family protein [Gammaproteobacteria bacterium]
MPQTDSESIQLARQLGLLLVRRGWKIATAESCTGGSIGMILTEVAGSSQWYDRGFITYSNAAKSELLGIPAAMIEDHGAVSREVARAMVVGALQHSQGDCAVSVTGIAGPSGGTPEKPVGTVLIGWAVREKVSSEAFLFVGDRHQIRKQSVKAALCGMIRRLRT